MPYIEAKLSVKLDENRKVALQQKLTDAIVSAFSKPEAYIMTNIEDEKMLFMGSKKIEKAAYISIKSLGLISKSACQISTKTICNILNNDLGIDASNVYITYHPVDLWGWNNSMF